MALFQPAVKAKLKARVAIDGPTGSGKTWTALQAATVLSRMVDPPAPIGLVDTENRSAAYYAPTPGVVPQRVNWWDAPYEFGHLPKSPPYSPIELRALIVAAADELGPDGVLVIDSLTHYWTGEGGTLNIVDDANSRNSFAGWKEGTPAQRGMLDAIIHAPCHVIVTMRSKMEYLLVEENRGGRTVQVPTKVGMAPEQRAGVEYEFTVVADMDLEHRMVVSKSRCDLIADMVAPKGRSVDVFQTFASWLNTGADLIDAEQMGAIVARINAAIPGDDAGSKDTRTAVKRLLLDEFGRLDQVVVEKLPALTAWLDEALAPFDVPAAAADPPAAPAPEPVAAPDAPEVATADPPAETKLQRASREAAARAAAVTAARESAARVASYRAAIAELLGADPRADDCDAQVAELYELVRVELAEHPEADDAGVAPDDGRS